MFIDIKKFFSERQQQTQFDFSFDYSKEEMPGYVIKNPCVGNLSFELQGSLLKFQLNAEAEIKTVCARCAKPVETKVILERTVTLTQDSLHDEDESLPLTENEKLDVMAFVLLEILTTAPSIVLCSENCKGICPVCGKDRDLNCNCDNQHTDERLAILKQLLS